MSLKKRCMLAFFLAIALMSTASLSQAVTEEFNDEILSGESIDIDDFTFIITMNKYANAIFIDAGEMFQTVPLFGCKKMEHFRVCFDNTTYDEEENELFANVRIFRYKPDLTITRSINDTELFTGQEAEVTIEIENRGDPAEHIILTDDYPWSIEVYDLEGGCQEHENQVYWTGHLDANETLECKFIIRPIEELHQSLVAHMRYWDGFKWEDEYSSTLTLDVEPVVEILTAVVREDFEVDGRTFDFEEDPPVLFPGEVLRLIINITNNHDEEDIKFDWFEINLPPNLEFTSIGYLRFNYLNATGNRTSHVWSSDRITQVTPRLLRWNGRLSSGNTKSFILKLESSKTGSQNVLMSTQYRYDGMTFHDEPFITFDVLEPGVDIRMTLLDTSKRFSAPERLGSGDDDEDDIDLEALHPYKITVYTQNSNKYAILTD
jgi:hypothetical protein